jgi:hypothetical protein
MSGGTGTPDSGTPAEGGRRGGRLDGFAGLVAPEQAATGKGWKFALVSLVAGLCVAGAVTGVFEEGWSRLWERNRAERQEAVADALEDGKAPFTAKMWLAMPADRPHSAFVLDRRLTAGEQALPRSIKGQDYKATWEFVRARGGRRVGQEAAEYKLQLTSERQKTVVITEITARASRCREPRQATFITDAPGGAIRWEGILFELRQGLEVPALEYADPAEPGPYPEFSKAIVLGGSSSPGLLRINPDNDDKISCEFEVILTYNVDSGPSQKHTISNDEQGRPLFYEGMPTVRSTDQWRAAGGGTWKPEHELYNVP